MVKEEPRNLFTMNDLEPIIHVYREYDATRNNRELIKRCPTLPIPFSFIKFMHDIRVYQPIIVRYLRQYLQYYYACSDPTARKYIHYVEFPRVIEILQELDAQNITYPSHETRLQKYHRFKLLQQRFMKEGRNENR